tara:strand:- start:479 stop:973 length:495 start_codon:yes stop_codon:yes gene_type:complete
MLRYIKIIDNQPINYTTEQLFIDHPDATIYTNTSMPNEKLLLNYDVYPLITEARPRCEEEQVAEEGPPVFDNGEWHQTWQVRNLTQEEINEIVTDRENGSDQVPGSVADEDVPNFFVDTAVQESRYDICKACDSLSVLKTCKECHCIMPIKTRLTNAVCPIGKW